MHNQRPSSPQAEKYAPCEVEGVLQIIWEQPQLTLQGQEGVGALRYHKDGQTHWWWHSVKATIPFAMPSSPCGSSFPFLFVPHLLLDEVSINVCHCCNLHVRSYALLLPNCLEELLPERHSTQKLTSRPLKSLYDFWRHWTRGPKI